MARMAENGRHWLKMARNVFQMDKVQLGKLV